MKKLGIDTGGTFTDLIGVDTNGRIRSTKVLSSPEDPTLAISRGIQDFKGVEQIVHGTTVATNALLERRGAKSALIVNKGFEDILILRRQARPQLYGLQQVEPEHVVPRSLVRGVAGRLDEQGREVSPLDLEALMAFVGELQAEGVESVAICLLHAYANPAHELAARETLEACGLQIPISLSHEVHSAFREYERASTTGINAYVQPKMQGYLERIEELAASVEIMQSNGGVTEPEFAAKFPVNTLLSGPAGGVVGAQYAAEDLGIRSFLTLDIGGTSTDVSLVQGTPSLRELMEIDSLAIAVPSLDIHTVGAGGGSIAWVDEGGALRVGPRSAGSTPGPVVFGREGKEITLTDAHVFLGRIEVEKLEARGIAVDVELMTRQMQTLADRLRMRPDEVAEGIIRIANSVMGRALKVVSVSRGIDVSGLALIAFGGGGGLHMCELAEELGIGTCVLPAHSEVLSAWGLFQAGRVGVSRQTLLHELDQGLIDTLKAQVTGGFTELELLLRYRGQGFELEVSVEDLSAISAVELEHRFKRRHGREYGYEGQGIIECVGYRVISRSPAVTKPEIRTPAGSEGASIWMPEGWVSRESHGHIVMERQ